MAQAQKSGGGGGSLYYEIANFQAGMDLRKSPLTAPAGTLRLLQNAHITQGGEIEKRPAFKFWCDAPAGSFGLISIDALAYVTVNNAGRAGDYDEPTDTAIGVMYIGPPIHQIKVSAAIYDGTSGTSPGPGTVMEIYDISFPDEDITGGSATYPIAVGARVYGTGVSPNTVITAIPSGGGLGTYAVNNSQLSYPSSVDGPPTGEVLDEQISFDIFQDGPFVIYQSSVTQNLSYCYYDVGQVPEANGLIFCKTYKEKMYGLAARYLVFSAVGDPSVWNDPSPDVLGNVAANGSGFIDISSNDADSFNLLGMEVYYDKMAIFSKLSCQLWFLDPDPSLNQYFQTLRDAGTIAPSSVRQYVANDVYFLGTHGIRSLRARDLTTTAAVADVGSAIDPPIQDIIASSPYADFEENYWVKSILDPRTGRIWVCFKDIIYVLSNWASPNISAWSVYVPEFEIDIPHVVYADPYLILRATDGKIYRFGGDAEPVYDSCPVEFDTPFLSFDKPATFKFYQGFDAICSALPGSNWNIEMSFDPIRTPTPFDQICTLDTSTIMDGRIPISGRGTHVQVRATHAAPGPATFSKLFIHYAPSDTG
jgi:hypothetical protein